MRTLSTVADFDLDRTARRSVCVERTPAEAMGDLGHKPWWIDFPINGRYFTKFGALATPALGSSLQSVLSFQVPAGWDGVIRLHSINYTGPGFVQGSGDLVFSIRRAGAMVEDYGQIITELGSAQQPRAVVIIVRENQLIEYLVSVSAAALIPVANTFINAYADGWFKPRSQR